MPFYTVEEAAKLIEERCKAVRALEQEREELRNAASLRAAAWDERRIRAGLRVQEDRERVAYRKAYFQLSRVMYALWRSMHARCMRDPNYAGRVSVCPRWNSFHNFWADMRDRPSPSHSLGRIDNDGDYTPGNVRWETVHQQSGNKRTGKPSSSGVVGVTWDSNKKRWSAEGVVFGTRAILYRGPDLEQAILCRKAWEKQVQKPVLDLPME